MTRGTLASLFLLAALTFAGGCVSSPSANGAGAGATPGASGQRSRTASITADEARETGASNAYDVVQSLRPMWLRTRGTQSVTQDVGIAIYLDNTRLGGLETLRQVGVADVESIQYYSAAQAQARWGQDNAQGAIVVVTKK